MNRPGKLLRYSASAGSGKTHALTGFYLSRVLYDPSSYRRILAVTFTNAAAAEMKGRILSRLYELGAGSDGNDKTTDEFVDYLCSNYGELFPDRESAVVTVKRNAPIALRNILHDYSRFSVGTIDSFFQRIIRAFAREMDIPSGYEIELEHDMLLGDAVDDLLGQVADDMKLRSWITTYVTSRLDENRNWDVRREIMTVARQIFGEEFRQLEPDEREKLSDYKVVEQYSNKVYAIKRGFESALKKLATRGMEITMKHNLSVEDFAHKKTGVGGWLSNYSRGEIKPPNTYWRKALDEGSYLPKDADAGVKAVLDNALRDGLGDIISEISGLFESKYPLYLSALAQVRTIYIMGILGAISEKVRLLAHRENLFLLSDSGELISKLIADDDTPFIYEKIGTAYDHYIIDEFQDTSGIQWKNFMPLINETLARGKDNLIVGDVKQSIYRWRNGDWRILHEEVTRTFGDDTVKTVTLSVNFRSRHNIIRFNNALFDPAKMPALCDQILQSDKLRFGSVYSGSVQEEREDKPGGYVKVSLYEKEGEDKWQQRVLNDLPALIEELQDHGYKANDILFLCRTNEEGKKIIGTILEYSGRCPPEQLQKYNYEVTSGESLLIERNPAVTMLVSAFRYLLDSKNRINISRMVRSYCLARGKDDSVYLGDIEPSIPDNLFPEGWQERMDSIRNTSLFSSAERMIELFGLGEEKANVAYLNSFQDVVLSYSSRYSSDISSFLNWWDNEGCRKTLAQSDNQEAMRIMTIHKAKGLQSRVVIIPFVAWEFSGRRFDNKLLWIREVPEAFAPMPVIMPELSSQLESSLFSDEARMERASEWLDGLNLMYVAFTRAVDALYIMSPQSQPSKGTTVNADILLNSIVNEGVGDGQWTEGEGVRYLSCGELPPVSYSEKKPSVTLDRYRVSPARGRLKLRTGSALPPDEIKLDESGGRAYGIMMHELLSRISTTGDIDTAIDHVCERGLVRNTQRSQLKEKISEMLDEPRVKEWFDGSYAVRAEAAVIMPSGTTRRPDRIMMREGETIIVDFKFGEPSDRHLSQTREYEVLLREMGYEGVSSYLWYVERDMIVKA